MNENVIYKLSKAFALRIIKLFKFLRDEKKEFVISKQIYRSGTSIGANVAESLFAQSEADYAHKLRIALKEANETRYWLELLHESETISESEFTSLNNDLNILIGTFVNIINKLINKEK
ncbi:MAG: four helix bundle protein [Prevotella sp.]|nr:four helix bundle protein [Prevotella sp.]